MMKNGYGSDMSGGGLDRKGSGSVNKLPAKKVKKKNTTKKGGASSQVASGGLERTETKKSALPSMGGGRNKPNRDSSARSQQSSSISATSKSPAPHRRSDTLLSSPLPTILQKTGSKKSQITAKKSPKTGLKSVES